MSDPIDITTAAAGILVVLAGAAAATAYASSFDKIPQYTSQLTGENWVDELLAGHDGQFYNEMGLHKHVFRKLLKVLERLASVQDTKHVSAQEQLAIFLHFVRRAASNRGLQERFQRSPNTITKIIHRILDAITSPQVYSLYVKLPTADVLIPDEIQDRQKYFPYFKDCLGALDGSHIPAYVPEICCALYRNRKGQVSQNVLAVSSFDMCFLYMLSGWEGSAPDTRVFEDARTHDFRVPPGQYYLGDGGYGGSDSLLVPYRGVRYHLKEWGVVRERPKDYRELFNLRHAELQNVIERIFGVLKKRFKVLIIAQEYDLTTQARLVSALAVLHNFIWIHDPEDLVDDDNTDNDNSWEADTHGSLQNGITNEERARAAACRDLIAKAMWADYIVRRRTGHH